MLIRNALCRLAAEAPKASPHDLPHPARVLSRSLSTRNSSTRFAARTLPRAYLSILESRRSYATASATKPTATVKKAVKAAAKKKTAPKTKKATATKKTAAKKKPVAKKKKKPAVKKPAPKKRVKKVLTPEQQEKAKITSLRKTALREPVSRSALSAYHAYIADKVPKGESAPSNIGAASTQFKNLTPAELEHYNHLAQKKNEERSAEYKRWIESHSVEDIRLANNARLQLRRIYEAGDKKLKSQKYPAHTSKLIDERAVKRPATALTFFVKERHASGDMKGIKTSEATRLIVNEYKALSASERKTYEDLAEADKARYKRESSAESA